MENKFQWKKLVTRESTFLERILRFEGYKHMLPNPFTVKQKDLLAVYSNGMTTQYIKADDFTSKIEDIKNDLDKIGFEKIVDKIKQFFDKLDNAKTELITEQNHATWDKFEASYKLSRAIILYSSNLATFYKQSTDNKKEREILQRIYDDAEAKSSSAWKDLSGFFKIISDTKNIPLNKLYLYSNDEFSALLLNNVRVENNFLEQRENLTVMRLEHYETELLFGNEASVRLDQLEIEKEIIISDKKEVHGSVAYKGNVRGIAKLILSKADYSKIKEGDILITFMTHPDMMSILSKISGIITDEGGILCHAAIVSREMKKPCIIATKIATKIFKDGDVIEVDANNGIAKIIK